MKTALDVAESKLDDQERQFVAEVREHGWFNTRVFDDKDELPDFSYSTGFFSSLGFPEIILFSLSKDVSHSILWDIYRDLRSGKKLPISARTLDVFGNAEAVLLPVAKHHYREHLGWTRWFYGGDDFPCLQLIWPDPAGRFPWEHGFNLKFAESQPDLTSGDWNSHPRSTMRLGHGVLL